jgi:hypothetical protein
MSRHGYLTIATIACGVAVDSLVIGFTVTGHGVL